jgi:hypothetical protein
MKITKKEKIKSLTSLNNFLTRFLMETVYANISDEVANKIIYCGKEKLTKEKVKEVFKSIQENSYAYKEQLYSCSLHASRFIRSSKKKKEAFIKNLTDVINEDIDSYIKLMRKKFLSKRSLYKTTPCKKQ